MTRFNPTDHDFDNEEFEGIEKGLCGCRKTVAGCSCADGWAAGLTMCYCLREECLCTTTVSFRAD